MLALARLVPDGDVLLSMPPEELAGKLLVIVRDRMASDNQSIFHPGNLLSEISGGYGSSPYPNHPAGEVGLAIKEAFAWLEAQALILPADGVNGTSGWRVLSRRARTLEDPSELAPLAAGQILAPALVHPSIPKSAVLAFKRGEYDTAAFQAMRQVEIELRKYGGADQERQTAVQLARRLFAVEDGYLSDLNAERSEREAMGHLFVGALGVLKNPHSHRNVDIQDPADAASVLAFASHLLRIIEARASGVQ